MDFWCVAEQKAVPGSLPFRWFDVTSGTVFNGFLGGAWLNKSAKSKSASL